MRKEINDFNGLNALDEDTLTQVVGGAKSAAAARARSRGRSSSQVTRIACCFCGGRFPVDLSLSEVKCKYCGETNTLSG